VLRAGIVDRPALVEQLLATTHAPVVLLSAPAGYGKTTLLALWSELDERPFAWVTLDASDSDPIALVAALLSALTPVVAVDASVGESLEGAEAPLEEYVLPSLAQACVETQRPFVLVLDDVHLVT
jgi:LuxR family maltose regulon positive regulatory protein